MPQSFSKYTKTGAYHFDCTIGAKHWYQFNPRLTARYMSAVKLLDPKPGEQVLDAGSGEGVSALLCCRRGALVAAVELEPEACRLGESIRDRHGFSTSQLRFWQQDVLQLPFPDNSFDKVISLEVIEHMRSVHQFLRELHRVLKPGGRIVLSTPLRRQDGKLQDPYHLVEFNPSSLRMALSAIFNEVSILSPWPRWLNNFYETNWPTLFLSKIKRGTFKLAGVNGIFLFRGPCTFDPTCSCLLAVGTK